MTAIQINGVEYPCRATMGAMLRFKRETGKEVTELGASDLSAVVVYLWCCCASACAADGVEFKFGVMDFADALSPEEVAAWTQSLGAESASGAADAKKNSK